MGWDGWDGKGLRFRLSGVVEGREMGGMGLRGGGGGGGGLKGGKRYVSIVDFLKEKKKKGDRHFCFFFTF